MSKIPVKPFQPLPPLVRMERIRDSPKVHNAHNSPNHSSGRHSNGRNDTDPWMIDSPTNRSVALLVTSASGISHDAILHTSSNTTSPNDSSNDLWNPLMMMMMMDEDDDDDDHHPNVVLDPMDSYYDMSPNPVATTAKRVSLDVSDATCVMMDVENHHESLLLQQQQQQRHDLPMMASTDNHDHHDFELMEGLEHDPLLTLSVTCGMNDIVGTTTGGRYQYHDGRISDSLNPHESEPQPLSPLRRFILSGHNDDYDVDHDELNDPWSEAAAEAAFQMTASTTAFGDDPNDQMVFEIDQSFLKANGHTTTVGTESTVSSYSGVSSDLLSVLTCDNNHRHSHTTATATTTSTVPTLFTSQQFQERCQLLSESMRASQLSRQCLSLQENIKLRANLAKVLKDIERSTAKVQRHCLSQHMPPQDTLGTTTVVNATFGHDTTDIASKTEINNDLLAQLENDSVDDNDNDDANNSPVSVADRKNSPVIAAPTPSSTTTTSNIVDYHTHPTMDATQL